MSCYIVFEDAYYKNIDQIIINKDEDFKKIPENILYFGSYSPLNYLPYFPKLISLNLENAKINKIQSSIKRLTLIKCPNITEIKDMENLEELELIKCENIKIIEGCPKLRKVIVDSLQNLEKIKELKEIIIFESNNCSKLTMDDNKFEKLKSFKVQSCFKIQNINLPKSLKILDFDHSINIDINNFKELIQLRISDNNNINNISGFKYLHMLSIIRTEVNFIDNCRLLKTIISQHNYKLNYIYDIPKLNNLECFNCKNLVSIPRFTGSLQVKNCDRLLNIK
jgi:hypothetical protein